MPQSYSDLEIYQLSYELFLLVHPFSLLLPSHETHELGSNLRRHANEISTHIVEGFTNRENKEDYLSSLQYAYSKTEVTLNDLLKVRQLYAEHEEIVDTFLTQFELLAAKILKYIKYVEERWLT